MVTGGAHRVGRGISLALAEAGANVVINYNSSADAAIATAAEIEALGVGALPVQANISDPVQVTAMIGAADKEFGGIDIVVNSASHFQKMDFPTDSTDIWFRTVDTLIHGPFFIANAVAPGMLERERGVFVSIGDLSAFEPWPQFAGHAVGKAGLLALSRQLALELAPHIRSNVVVAGPTLPPHDYDEARIQRTADDTLAGRWGSPADIAQAVLFFIEAEYITGETLIVDGGQHFARRKREAG